MDGNEIEEEEASAGIIASLQNTAVATFRNIIGEIYINAAKFPGVIETISNCSLIVIGGLELTARMAELASNVLDAGGPYPKGPFPRGDLVEDQSQQNLDHFFPGIDDVTDVGNNQFDVIQQKSTVVIQDQVKFRSALLRAARNLADIPPDKALQGQRASGENFTLLGRQIRNRGLQVYS